MLLAIIVFCYYCNRHSKSRRISSTRGHPTGIQQAGGMDNKLVVKKGYLPYWEISWQHIHGLWSIKLLQGGSEEGQRPIHWGGISVGTIPKDAQCFGQPCVQTFVLVSRLRGAANTYPQCHSVYTCWLKSIPLPILKHFIHETSFCF